MLLYIKHYIVNSPKSNGAYMRHLITPPLVYIMPHVRRVACDINQPEPGTIGRLSVKYEPKYDNTRKWFENVVMEAIFPSTIY